MDTFHWIAVAIVTAGSIGRISRLVVGDVFPPSVWLRTRYDALTNDGPWSELVHCGYCFSMWVAPGVVLWGWVSGWDTAWWLVNGTLAAAYAGAYVMAYDAKD